ncbi:hypothetical protein [Streptomyces sp. NPDC101237]|uniref:hypothetical protein n=1 Tax=Streptomyces sp. NPDC101237 TaxID=3366139 RepID=UPI003812E3AE
MNGCLQPADYAVESVQHEPRSQVKGAQSLSRCVYGQVQWPICMLQENTQTCHGFFAMLLFLRRIFSARRSLQVAFRVEELLESLQQSNMQIIRLPALQFGNLGHFRRGWQ